MSLLLLFQAAETGTTVEFDGTITAAGSLSGNLVETLSFGGTTTAGSTLSGAPVLTVVFGGTSTAGSTFTGNLSVSGAITFSGTITALAVLSGGTEEDQFRPPPHTPDFIPGDYNPTASHRETRNVWTYPGDIN
jgi:hypothetical protein